MRDMVHTSQLMGHAVDHPQATEIKGDSSHIGSIGHGFPGFQVSSVMIAPGQVFQDQFHCFAGHGIGEVCRAFGNISFERMGQDVEARIGRNGRRNRNRQLRI